MRRQTAGRPATRVVHTVDEILELVSAYRELNFKPGDEYLYNNTAFTLLGVIVQRASGQNELYDCRNDPAEDHNLAGDPASQTVLQEMQAALRAGWRKAQESLLLTPCWAHRLLRNWRRPWLPS